MADPTAVATEFAKFYYDACSKISQNQDGLSGLYRDNSMLTFESDQHVGTKAILEKLTVLTEAKHEIVTLDCQPFPGGLLVLITGKVTLGEHPIPFSQAFSLIADQGTYYVLNDLFRLNYG